MAGFHYSSNLENTLLRPFIFVHNDVHLVNVSRTIIPNLSFEELSIYRQLSL